MQIGKRKCMSSAVECNKCLGSSENALQVVVSEPEMLSRFYVGALLINTGEISQKIAFKVTGVAQLHPKAIKIVSNMKQTRT